MENLKVGDRVNYHMLAGGSITSRDHEVWSIDLKPNNFGEDVAFIRGVRGCVSFKNLSIYKKSDGIIPLDDRYNNYKPKITNSMKGACIGEYKFYIDEPCPLCFLHLDEAYYDEPECLCDGSDDKTYQKEMVVPWDTCKEIYQGMATVAMSDFK